ncbi:MAG: hypothetical protein V2A62_00470 [Candidatus Woesearchaeota archaeon]
MKLKRAINKTELAELLTSNKLTSKSELINDQEYSFFVHTGTIWINYLGKKKWNIQDIAKNEPDKSGVIVSLKVWLGRKFRENPSELGKYYCVKEHLARVKFFLV